jgi:hypothetical protein
MLGLAVLCVPFATKSGMPDQEDRIPIPAVTNVAEFIGRFGSQRACLEHLKEVRWRPRFERFVCPGCGHARGWCLPRRRLVECCDCHRHTSITGGNAFTMAIDYLGSGGVWGYTATIPAGQVGLWCSDNSDNDFDDFKVQDIAGPFEADGRWFSNTGDVRVDDSDNNVLETYGSYEGWRTIVRRGFRADD